MTSESAFSHHRKFKLNPKYVPQRVPFNGYPPGTIVVDRRKRFLYLAEDSKSATRYRVGVGRASRSLQGTAVVGRKQEWPGWRPTDDMIRRNPWKYAHCRNGVPGGPQSPFGSPALYLYRNSRDTYYRIHGNIKPRSIGRAVSAGCIRMLNEHVEQLYDRVPVGTRVVIL